MSGPKRATRDLLGVVGPAALLAAAGFVLAYQFVDPAPPARLTMAAGAPGGAYHHFATRYRELLARHGVDVRVLETAGSVENVRRLRAADGGVQVGFVQGGTGGAADDLVSLASLYYEPVWVFLGAGIEAGRLADLKGRRIAVGPEGSGTRAIALEVLAQNAADGQGTTLLPLAGEEALEAVTAGRVDAVFVVAGTTSQVVGALARAPGVRLMSFDRAEAYTRRNRFLSSVTVPEGVLDLAANLPDRDVVLVAATANLVARADFHPALVDLMMAAARKVHGAGGLLEEYGQFPSPRYLEFPLSEEARRYFDSGPSFLRRVLPFWAATLVERMAVMLLPLVALLIPLVRILPPVYRWRIRSRVYRWYAELLSIDPVVLGQDDPQRVRASLAQLDRIEQEVAKVHVPMSYADELYALRVHIELVRDKLEAALAAD